VVLAGLLQRVTGIGFALVASPILILLVGADEAVRLVLVTSLISCGYSLVSTWVAWEPAEVLPLVPFAILAIWPSALLAQSVSSSLATMVAGLVVLVAVAVALRPKGIPGTSKWGQAAVAGTLSGAMNAVAALGGPMAATYGVGRQWGRSLVPNMQLYLFLTSVTVLLVRGWPAQTSSWQLILLMVAAAAGVWVGGHVAASFTPVRARRLTVLISVIGALAAVGRGIEGLI
jgi:uncharacterized membrane protein YfcA